MGNENKCTKGSGLCGNKIGQLGEEIRLDTKEIGPFFSDLKYKNKKRFNKGLGYPPECKTLRNLARKPSKLRLYRKHFTSHDAADWFLYTALFGEKWHSQRREPPKYLDIAANHAKRWSSTWFFDRCMGWDGICAEPNDVYWQELKENRSCKLVPSCLSDRIRKVNFSFTEAFGGVVANTYSKEIESRMGVNGTKHAMDKKFSSHFHGIKELTCQTITHVLDEGSTEHKKFHYDFLSLDVEGHEYPILEGIDWERITIDVILTENRSPEVKRLLIEKGFNHYPKVHKDDLWILSRSNLKLDDVAVEWMRALNRSTFLFPSDIVDDENSGI